MKKTKRFPKVKNPWSWPKFTLLFKNIITITLNFLAFFQFFPLNFSLLDPDPQIECGYGSRMENECGSMWIRIHSPAGEKGNYLSNVCRNIVDIHEGEGSLPPSSSPTLLRAQAAHHGFLENQSKAGHHFFCHHSEKRWGDLTIEDLNR